MDVEVDVDVDPRAWNVGALVAWPVLVAVVLPPTQLALGHDRGDAVSVLLVAGATVAFARYGFLGVLRTDCGSCGGRVPVGGLYCPHCGGLRSTFAAPLVQTLLAVLVLPYGWFVVAGLTSRVLLALAGAVPALSPYATFYRAGVGGAVEVGVVLALTALVPVALTTGCKAGLRVAGTVRASGSGG